MEPSIQQCSRTFAIVYLVIGIVLGVLGVEVVVYCWSRTVRQSPPTEPQQVILTDGDSQESFESEDFLASAQAQAKKYGALGRSIGSVQ